MEGSGEGTGRGELPANEEELQAEPAVIRLTLDFCPQNDQT